MKILSIIFFGLIFLTNTSQANSREIERKVVLLGKMAYGVEEHKVSVKNSSNMTREEIAEEMIIQLAMKTRAESRKEILESFHRNLLAKDINFGDMMGWGTMRSNAAVALYQSQDVKRNSEGEDLTERHEKNMKLGAEVIKELTAIDALYGFTDHSSSYCGVTFMGLLVVDVEAEIIYEISLTSSGEC